MEGKRLFEPSDVNPKKFCTNEDNRNSSITCFEHLSNEIHYEIFDYLDGLDIFRSFFNLNHRFDQLISSPSFSLKISLDEISHFSIKHLILPNKHRILSFHLSNSINIDQFFRYCILNETFDRLESIKLFCSRPDDTMSALFHFKSLPRLFALTIHLLNGTHDIQLNNLYRLILCLPWLKSNSLISDKYSLIKSSPLAMNQRFSNIEYLVLKHVSGVNALLSILNHTPRLHYLRCQTLGIYRYGFARYSNDDDEFERLNQINEKNVLTILPNLTYLSIQQCFIQFEQFQTFSKICPQLERLCIGDFSGTKEVYLHQWKEMILQNLSQLSKCDIHCHFDMNDDSGNNQYEFFTDVLIPQFWIERGWTIEFQIRLHYIDYSIQSKRKTWFLTDEHPPSSSSEEETANTTMEMCSPGRDFFRIVWGRYNIGIGNFLPLRLQFTSLFISHEDLSIGDIAHIISSMPNLRSLKVSSLSLDDLDNLSPKDVEKLRLASINNRITRVHQPMVFPLMRFLIGLCPRMECFESFELPHLQRKDRKKFIRDILTETMTRLPHLRCLHFRVNKVNHVQRMIDSEELFSKYLIQRVNNIITLQLHFK